MWAISHYLNELYKIEIYFFGDKLLYQLNNISFWLAIFSNHSFDLADFERRCEFVLFDEVFVGDKGIFSCFKNNVNKSWWLNFYVSSRCSVATPGACWRYASNTFEVIVRYDDEHIFNHQDSTPLHIFSILISFLRFCLSRHLKLNQGVAFKKDVSISIERT